MKIEFLTSLYRIMLELVTEWNLDLDNSRKYIFFLIKILFSHRHVYKFCQRNLFFSEVPKVDLTRFGNKLFNFRRSNHIYPLSKNVNLFKWYCFSSLTGILQKYEEFGLVKRVGITD